jgi:hypothetical protein
MITSSRRRGAAQHLRDVGPELLPGLAFVCRELGEGLLVADRSG